MKTLTLGVFSTREHAEMAIKELQNSLSIKSDDISYVYRNTDNEVREVDVDGEETETTLDGAASGALTGGALGAVAGIATVIGIIPVIGPIFAAGPLLAALGLGAGAVGTTAAAAATGAVAGGLIGALANWGVTESQAQAYQDRVMSGDILVSVHSENELSVADVLSNHGATSVETFTPTV